MPTLPTVEDVGSFLEEKARAGEPITYGRVRERFPELPHFDGIWEHHPLCAIFGALDAEDHANQRPFRTALVHVKDSIPGDGFFKMLTGYRNMPTGSRDDKQAIWINELNMLLTYYASLRSR